MKLRGIVETALICTIWGSGFTAMKVCLNDLPPFLLVGTRFVLTAVVLAFWLYVRGERLSIPRERWPIVALLTLFFFTQQSLIFVGLRITLASRTAVILNTQPIITAILAHFFVRGDRLTWLKVVGLIVALAGVQMLFRGGSSVLPPRHLLGDAMVLIAAAVWGTQTVVTKRVIHALEPGALVLWQSIGGSAMFLAVGALVEPWSSVRITSRLVLSMAYLVVVATVYSFVRWFDLLREYNPSLVTSFCFITPVAGVVFGWALLGDPITGDIVLGALGVGAGILCANLPIARRAKGEVS